MTFRVYRKPSNAPKEDIDEALFFIEDSTSQLISVAARLFARTLQTRLASHGVSTGQWPLLLYLWEQDGLSQRQLSRRVQIEEPTTTRTLDRMERDDLVYRRRDERDRRRINVFLTARGKELKEELLPFAQEVNTLATHGLSAQDKTKINSLLTYIISRLE